MAVLGLAALLLGMAWNQAHPQGLGWRLLWLTLSDPPRSAAWTPLATDSAFALFIQGSAEFIDIRDPQAFALDHIPGAESRPFFDFFHGKDPAEWPSRDQTLVLYDFETNSRRAPLMVWACQKKGYRSVFFLRNGFKDWLDYGFPVQTGGANGSR